MHIFKCNSQSCHSPDINLHLSRLSIYLHSQEPVVLKCIGCEKKKKHFYVGEMVLNHQQLMVSGIFSFVYYLQGIVRIIDIIVLQISLTVYCHGHSRCGCHMLLERWVLVDRDTILLSLQEYFFLFYLLLFAYYLVSYQRQQCKQSLSKQYL